MYRSVTKSFVYPIKSAILAVGLLGASSQAIAETSLESLAEGKHRS